VLLDLSANTPTVVAGVFGLVGYGGNFVVAEPIVREQVIASLDTQLHIFDIWRQL
jgi:hypothetical protein